MNHDASVRVTHRSPSQAYVSPESESKLRSSGASQKRASRAGTRSVTTLSAAQLERKRANDREAQRAIRQRTKDHIETLERRINELTVTYEGREKMIAATQQRNRELEDENAYLRSRLGNESFALSVADADLKEKPAEYTVSAPTSSPQPQLNGNNIPRPSSTSTGRSVPLAPLQVAQHPDSWRTHHVFPSGGGPTSTPYVSEAPNVSNASPASWRAQDVSEAQSRIEQSNRNFAAASAAPDRSSWVSSAPAYGYQVRHGDRPPTYSSAPQSLSYPAHSQPPTFQTVPAPPSDSSTGSSAYHTSAMVPQGDYQQLSSYAPSQQPAFQEQSQPHSSYQVSSAQVPSADDYHGGTTNVHRGGLAPPAYNSIAASPQFMPAQPAHGQGVPMAYREANAQQQYGYDA